MATITGEAVSMNWGHGLGRRTSALVSFSGVAGSHCKSSSTFDIFPTLFPEMSFRQTEYYTCNKIKVGQAGRLDPVFLIDLASGQGLINANHRRKKKDRYSPHHRPEREKHCSRSDRAKTRGV